MEPTNLWYVGGDSQLASQKWLNKPLAINHDPGEERAQFGAILDTALFGAYLNSLSRVGGGWVWGVWKKMRTYVQ